MSSSTQTGSQIIRSRVKMTLALSPQQPTGAWNARPVTEADMPALAHLMLDSYRGTIDDEGETLEDALTEMQRVFSEEMGPLLNACSFMLERDGQALGVSLIVLWKKTGRPLLAEMLVHPTVQHQGLGRYLLQKSINVLLAEGYDEMALYVTQGNLPAQHLYEQVGFQVAATVFQEGFAEVNGAQVYYRMTGEGLPVVLIHSGLADSRMWAEQARALVARYRVIRYDLRGFGRSGMPPGPFSHRADLAELLRFLGAERAVLIGSSFGGQIAIDFALEYPEMVAGLVAVGADISGRQPSDFLLTQWSEIDALVEKGEMAQAVERELRLWVDGPGRTPEQVDQSVRELVREMNTNNFRRSPEQEQGQPQPLQPPALARLGELRAPTLVLVGELDVPDTLASAKTLAREIPGAKQVVMPGTAHLPSLEQPEEFNRLVLEFLGEL